MAFNDDAPILTLVSPMKDSVDLKRVNQDLTDTELKIAQNGYIFKAKGAKVFDLNIFKNADVYIQSIGNTTIDTQDKHYVLNDGDAAYGELSGELAVNAQNIALIFVFPKN